MNDLMYERYLEYQAMSPEQKRVVKHKPVMYAIRFITFEQIAQMQKLKSEEQTQKNKYVDDMIIQFMKGGGKLKF